MSRSSVPTHSQLEMLLECLEEKRWLATGHARTTRERDRTRAAWQEIAAKLNGEKEGCYKNWERWSKYWKDKKSAVRRKAMQIRMAKQQAGNAGIDESLLLSDVDEKIVELSGGKPFISGDREIEIEIIYPSPNESGQNCEYIVPEASDAELLCIQGITEEKQEEADSKQFVGRPQPEVPHRSPPNASSTPQKRRVMVRRPRLQHQSSHMTNLTERFIAIEEKRVENERLLIDNQEKMIDVLKNISEAWCKQSQALQDLCASFKRDS